MSKLNILAILAFALLPCAAGAQEVDEADFLKKLESNRSDSSPGDQKVDLNEIISRTRNKLLIEENDEPVNVETRVIAPEFQGLPTAEISIGFDYNSADITPASLPNVIKLARILTNPQLAGQRLVIAGHTDAKGTALYNMELSQRRADTVRNLLIGSFAVPPEKIVAIGFGEQQLKNPLSPDDGVNRRVEVINVGK